MLAIGVGLLDLLNAESSGCSLRLAGLQMLRFFKYPRVAEKLVKPDYRLRFEVYESSFKSGR